MQQREQMKKLWGKQQEERKGGSVLLGKKFMLQLLGRTQIFS